MSNPPFPTGGRAPRLHFVSKPAEFPVKPASVQPPTKCRDCGAVDIWCATCQAPHPIRSIEQGHDQTCHIAHCDQDPTLTPMQLRQPCPLAGKAATDGPLDPLAHERKREIAAVTIGILCGFIAGVVLTLATIIILSSAASPRGIKAEHSIEK